MLYYTRGGDCLKKYLVVIFSVLFIFVMTACNKETKNIDSSISNISQGTNASNALLEENESDNVSEVSSLGLSSSNNTHNNNANQSTQNNSSQVEYEPAQPSEPLSSNDTTNDNVDNEASIEKLVGVNKLRVDYDLGTCRNLSGNVSVILFYMDDFESSWTSDEITNFTNNEVKPGLAFLEKEAKSYGVELNLSIKQSYSSIFYDDEVILSIKETGLATIDVLSQAAYGLNYSSDEEMIADFKSQYETEVVCITIFNKNGTAYAINPPRGETMQIEEHCIVFAYDLNSDRNDPIGSQSSIVAHEMLHLFGAEDFYATTNRKTLAKKYYPADIMLGANYYIITNNIDDATAFYIGWSDEVPDVLYDENW